MSFNETHRDIVTYIRKHNEGKKVNLYIKYSKPYFGEDATELIISPTIGEEFRVIGVTYILKDNKQFLNTFMGNQTAKLTKTTKHAKRHFWLNDVCTCHGLLQSHSA